MNKEFKDYVNALKEVEKENNDFELTLSKKEVLFVVKNIEQLENIIKEAIDFIENTKVVSYESDEVYFFKDIPEGYDLLNILNKGVKNDISL